MNYAAGQIVKLGDRVQLGQDSAGMVVCVIDAGEYSADYPAARWDYLGKAALINFPSCGLIRYEELEPDVRLLARAASGAG